MRNKVLHYLRLTAVEAAAAWAMRDWSLISIPWFSVNFWLRSSQRMVTHLAKGSPTRV